MQALFSLDVYSTQVNLQPKLKHCLKHIRIHTANSNEQFMTNCRMHQYKDYAELFQAISKMAEHNDFYYLLTLIDASWELTFFDSYHSARILASVPISGNSIVSPVLKITCAKQIATLFIRFITLKLNETNYTKSLTMYTEVIKQFI